jgi:hypothetical protein
MYVCMSTAEKLLVGGSNQWATENGWAAEMQHARACSGVQFILMIPTLLIQAGLRTF